jgi:hypothetical protein
MLPVPPDLLDRVAPTGKSRAQALWTKKTANLFRGVVLLDCTSLAAEQAESLVRETIAAEYAPGLVVPFAFGTVLRYRHLAPPADSLARFVDDRARAAGTWQWIILVDEDARQASGTHMWMSGYLTPVYEALLKHYERQGYACRAVTRAPGRLWTRLWAVRDVLSAARWVLLVIVVVALAAAWLFPWGVQWLAGR